MQGTCCPKEGMTREIEFTEEIKHTSAHFLITLQWAEKDRLEMAQLLGDATHLLHRQGGTVQKDGETVAGIGKRGKHIDVLIGQCYERLLHHIPSVSASACLLCRRSLRLCRRTGLHRPGEFEVNK